MNEHLEIYKVVVDTITTNEGRRQRANTAYLGMLSAIATAAAAIPGLPLIAPVSVVFVLALTWLVTVLYFRRLAQAKFAVIAEIEENHLSLPAFKLEWQHFNGQRKFYHLSLTHLEMVIPVGVAIISAAYILYWTSCQIFPYSDVT